MANTKMNTGFRQRGIAILMVAFHLIVFFGLAAFVLDIGRLYIVKSQLQNSADSGALRGAKELDGIHSVTVAEAFAKQGARRNEHLLGTANLTDANITVHFSNTPYPDSWEATDAVCRANPYGCYYVRVMTEKHGIFSYVARIIGFETGGASALAVAGREEVEVTPLAICAVNAGDCGPGGKCGFIQGESYNLETVNADLGPGWFYWIDPLATTANPVCDYGSAQDMRPFICTGTIPMGVVNSEFVYGNTGQPGTSLRSLDTRFGVYSSDSKCDPATAPSDSNVKEYVAVTKHGGTITVDPLASWMDPPPNAQASYYSKSGAQQLGWVCAATRCPIDGRGVKDAPNPYDYPSTGTPYTQTTEPFYQAPPSSANVRPGRRMINIVVVECPSTKQATCDRAKNLGIGEFLLLRQSGADYEIDLEFVRMRSVGDIPNKILLYR